MIIWQGFGWSVAAIVFGFSLISNFVCDAVYSQGYYDNHKWPFAASLLLSAAICWFLGNFLKTRSDRTVIDKKTGKEFVINESRHALFFIPMHFWGPLLAVISLIIFLVEIISY